MNELEQIFSAAGDAGAVIVLAVCAWLIIRVVMSSTVKMAQLWRDAAKERNAIDEKRNIIDEKVADTMVAVSENLTQAVSENLTQLKETTGETRDIVVGVRRQHETLHATAIENHTAIMKELRPVIDGVAQNGQSILEHRAAIVSRLDTYGEKIDHLLKKIEVVDVPVNLRGDIEKLIQLITTVSTDVKALLPQERTATPVNTKHTASIAGYLEKQPEETKET
jgi:hypothetical protein